MFNECLMESLSRYVGQTVTIFTVSGGLSGSGFSGVLAGVSSILRKQNIERKFQSTYQLKKPKSWYYPPSLIMPSYYVIREN